MKSLGTLIKLQKREVDGQRMVVAALEGELAATIASIKALDAEVVRERDAVRGHVAETPSLAPYLKKMQTRKRMLEDREKSIAKKIDSEREVLLQLFETLKRYEVALESAIAELNAETARQEKITLDEIGAEQFRRAEEDSKDAENMNSRPKDDRRS